MEIKEEWRNVRGYEGLYQISNKGRIKSLDRYVKNSRKGNRLIKEKVLNPTDNGHGYKIIGLNYKGKRKNHYIHRLVAEAFIPNPYNKKCVNHIDYDRGNNNVDNLEWCTTKENMQHSVERMSHPKKFSRTNTGERYIYKRKNSNVYRIVIHYKEYSSCKTLEEAIKKRDLLIKELNYV